MCFHSVPLMFALRLVVMDQCFVTNDTLKYGHLPHDTNPKGCYKCPNDYAYAVQ
jgi:hypothetical protein